MNSSKYDNSETINVKLLDFNSPYLYSEKEKFIEGLDRLSRVGHTRLEFMRF